MKKTLIKKISPIFCSLVLAGILAFPGNALATDMTGMMAGNITGWVTDTNGNQVTPQAAVYADVAVSIDADGNIVATVTGSGSCTGGLGVHIDYTLSYNMTTGDLSGTYTTPATPTPQDIVFTSQGGLSWLANFQGNVVADGQTRPYSIDVALELPSTALFSGTQAPTGSRLSGPLSATVDLSAPISVPVFGINQTITTTMTMAGTWNANVVPLADGSSKLTGSISGTFSSAPVTISTLYGDIPINIAGNWGGSLFSDDMQNLRFAGTYASTDSTVSYSGDMTLSVPFNADGSISQLPFTFSGSPTVTVMGQSFTLPLSISGTIPFQMN